jgi:hypothetical protein
MGVKQKPVPVIQEVEKQEEVKIEVPVPDPTAVNPQGIVTAKRKSPIKRYNATPLRESHGMTTESNRFKEG